MYFAAKLRGWIWFLTPARLVLFTNACGGHCWQIIFKWYSM